MYRTLSTTCGGLDSMVWISTGNIQQPGEVRQRINTDSHRFARYDDLNDNFISNE